MNVVLNHAAEVLREHPAPAMEILELRRRLRERLPVHTPSCAVLREVLRRHPGRFLVVESYLTTPARPGEEPCWKGVLVVGLDPGTAGAAGSREEAWLTESVRWVARGSDARSGRSRARLYALLVGSRTARPQLARAA